MLNWSAFGVKYGGMTIDFSVYIFGMSSK